MLQYRCASWSRVTLALSFVLWSGSLLAAESPSSSSMTDPEKRKVFGEIARVLKPGGRMLVSDIVAQDLPEWARRDLSLYVACVAGAITEEEYLGGLEQAGLEKAEIRARLVYDASQLRGFLQCGCASGGDTSLFDEETAARLVASLEGRVWSARIYAEKPVA